MVKPSSIPFQSFVREIPTIVEKLPEKRRIEVGSLRTTWRVVRRLLPQNISEDNSEAAPVALNAENKDDEYEKSRKQF